MALKTFSKKSSPISTPVIVVAVIVILIIAYLLIQTPSVQQISSNKTITLAVNSSYNFNLESNSNASSIFLASSSSSAALLYLSRIPVLEKEVVLVPLTKGQIVNVSVYGSPYADLQISLVSGTQNRAVISLEAIPKSLNIRPAALQFLNSTSFGKNPTSTTTIPTQSTSPTTTVQGTSSATTTVASLSPTAQALEDANSSQEGALVVNFNRLYVNAASQCTPSAYNTTYISKESSAPRGPNTFENVTVAVPTSIFASNVKSVSSTLYNITYTATISIGDLNALQLQINTTTKLVKSYAFEGIFQDQNYADVLQQYQTFNESGNPCSVYVP